MSKYPKNAPLASMPGEEKETFKLDRAELNTVLFDTNVLSDFEGTTLINLRKFHKNSAALRLALSSVEEDEQQLRLQATKMADIVNSEDKTEDEKNAARSAFEASQENFYSEKHPVDLYVMKESEFPKDRKEYGKRPYYFQGSNEPKTVQYVTSYIDLLDLGIVKEGK